MVVNKGNEGCEGGGGRGVGEQGRSGGDEGPTLAARCSCNTPIQCTDEARQPGSKDMARTSCSCSVSVWMHSPVKAEPDF